MLNNLFRIAGLKIRLKNFFAIDPVVFAPGYRNFNRCTLVNSMAGFSK
jgi:hypothetical protein